MKHVKKSLRLVRWICGALAVLMLLGTGMMAMASTEQLIETVRIAALKGPTGMGLAHLLATQEALYEVEFATAPDEVVGLLASGQVDIAAMPTNLAATLYNKTNGGVRVLALNTLGVLSIMEKGHTIESVADLAGKTLWCIGQGATPEFTLRYILEKYNLADKVDVQFVADHAELATRAASGEVDLVMLPEPFVTSLSMQAPDFRIALDVTEAFKAAAVLDGQVDMTLTMGCWVVRKEFAEAHPEAVQAFVDAYTQSAAYVVENIEESAQWIEQFGIVPKAAVAAKALPNCHIVSITGEAMRTQLAPLLAMWYAANPAAVGGALPADDFYVDLAAR